MCAFFAYINSNISTQLYKMGSEGGGESACGSDWDLQGSYAFVVMIISFFLEQCS